MTRPELSGPDRRALIAAYRAAAYVLFDGEAVLTVRIGMASAGIDALLKRHEADSGTFITAWNPGSRRRSDAENRTAHRAMAERLDDMPVRRLAHEGRSPDGGWREEGFFVLDVPEATALAVAEAFGQCAVVRIARGAPATLLLTGIMPRE